MRILIKILDIASNNASNINVKEVRVGLGYLAVLLDDNRVGLAYTIREDFYRDVLYSMAHYPWQERIPWNCSTFLNLINLSRKQLGLQQPMPL